MEWNKLLSQKRESSAHKIADIRNNFQRDYDRIIFSNVFRRLQNKTQVFPLPGTKLVHNRLTHSLEVASVGRSIARVVLKKLSDKTDSETLNLLNDIDIIVSSACLAHDLGNPPFGHSGEETISSYFKEGAGKELSTEIPENQWSDLIAFEGNANAFRQLTHQFKGRRAGGMSLTFATLATLIKYPYPSFNKGTRKKYNVFNSEIDTFVSVMEECEVPRLSAEPIYARHPLSYMMEAADDICYLILDMEDAIVTDKNERLAFLRAMVINKLVDCVSNVYVDNYENIMNGCLDKSLIAHLPEHELKAMNECREFSAKYIYKHPSVVKIELTGFNVIGDLLNSFVEAIRFPEKTYNKKLLSIIPEQFMTEKNDMYSRLQVVLDYISNMTDIYAVQLYKDLHGMNQS